MSKEVIFNLRPTILDEMKLPILLELQYGVSAQYTIKGYIFYYLNASLQL